MKAILLLGILSLLMIFLFAGCDRGGNPTGFNPAKAKSVVLYDIDPREIRNYSEKVANVSAYPLKPEEVQLLFANTKTDSLNIWKGAFLGVVKCEDGKEYHLAISNFGRFAKVLETGQGIKFDGASGVEYERIKGVALRNVFIPERQRRNQANTN